MVPRQVLVAHRWMSVLCREGVDALRDHSPAAHAYADWSSLLLCVERLFSGPAGPACAQPLCINQDPLRSARGCGLLQQQQQPVLFSRPRSEGLACEFTESF